MSVKGRNCLPKEVILVTLCTFSRRTVAVTEVNWEMMRAIRVIFSDFRNL